MTPPLTNVDTKLYFICNANEPISDRQDPKDFLDDGWQQREKRKFFAHMGVSHFFKIRWIKMTMPLKWPSSEPRTFCEIHQDLIR